MSDQRDWFAPDGELAQRTLGSEPGKEELAPEAEKQGGEKLPTKQQPSPIISDTAWAHATATWVDSFVRSSPISQVSGAWNRLHEVLPHLRTMLEDAIKSNP